MRRDPSAPAGPASGRHADPGAAAARAGGHVAPPGGDPRAGGTTLRLRGVHKRFGDVVAVRDLDLDVRAGEFLTLLGPSGSGKTTLLNIVAGFLDPDAGEVYINDDLATLKPPHLRNIGMVFQSYALWPHMTVYENVAFPLRMRGRGRAEVRSRVQDTLALVKLEGLGSRLPRQLSGGQQQRVALARALVFNPALLLMDEPLSALDKKLREQMQLEIKHLQRALGITVIYVTHDQNEALLLSDRIAVLNHGTIEQLGTPADLYNRPANSFVADFVGESNLLTGCARVAASGGGRCTFETLTGTVLEGTTREAVQPGDAVTAVIRPERIQLVPSDGPAGGVNVCRATVREVIYLGDWVKYRVELASRDVLSLKVPDRGQGVVSGAGTPVHVGVSPDDVMVYRSEMAERVAGDRLEV